MKKNEDRKVAENIFLGERGPITTRNLPRSYAFTPRRSPDGRNSTNGT